MGLNYLKLSKHPYNFLQIAGVGLLEFGDIVERIRPEFEKIEVKKKRHGRTSHLPLIEDKVLCVLIYYRTYITHTFLGYLFNLHNANICRLLKKIEPLLANKVTIKKDRTLNCEKLLKILADVTEQPTQRPSKEQKKSYSGKKKKHTLKTEIVIEESGKGE